MIYKANERGGCRTLRGQRSKGQKLRRDVRRVHQTRQRLHLSLVWIQRGYRSGTVSTANVWAAEWASESSVAGGILISGNLAVLCFYTTCKDQNTLGTVKNTKYYSYEKLDPLFGWKTSLLLKKILQIQQATYWIEYFNVILDLIISIFLLYENNQMLLSEWLIHGINIILNQICNRFLLT